MSHPILQTVPLGGTWGTADPFLLCVHHLDDYPRGNARLGPDASLGSREIGRDFSGADGWSMYHGCVVPGFPQHPHRGFETVTFVRRGLVDHSDSLGATARYGRGDVQWLTAGSGIVHCEMFPLVDPVEPNPLELFQIWLNLPEGDKMVDPYFTMQWDEEIPRHSWTDDEGRRGEVTVVAGELGGVAPLAPPPDSYASRRDADVAIWQLVVGPSARGELPPASSARTVRTVYVFCQWPSCSTRWWPRKVPTPRAVIQLDFAERRPPL
ncbi:MAG: pirin family protein, partial [Actinomycetota bacterium]|nr:pirin family protein [Actinomycetota bacterium]